MADVLHWGLYGLGDCNDWLLGACKLDCRVVKRLISRVASGILWVNWEAIFATVAVLVLAFLLGVSYEYTHPHTKDCASVLHFNGTWYGSSIQSRAEAKRLKGDV